MRFTELSQVKEYVNNERILCFECGKTFQMLCTHLKVHGMNEAMYREKYNIPPSIALHGTAVRRKMSASNKTPAEVLSLRRELPQMVSERGNGDGNKKKHQLFIAEFVKNSRAFAESKKTVLDEEKIKAAYQIYITETQAKACLFLGVSPPTFHKWLKRMGLPLKFT